MNGSAALTVVMVDDTPPDVQMVKRYLQKPRIPWSIEFISFLMPENGLEYLLKSKTDLLFLDYQFPTTDGLTFLKRLKKRKQPPPIILLTGKGNDDVAVRAFRREVEGYMTKENLNTQTLRRAIQRALSKESLGKEIPL
ncbi:MAG: two-component system response regulator [bacterium]